ncbi:molybdenum cofactor biosysynthesis protein [Alkalihalobacillus alcalophilus ATCC 27647 = CGMCC 1.3604]|nr:MOSC domain-containing protein [Alkalihalobacillus alcalophilus]MED1561449.1 MOSC domain-containing protein [Alkalihalobacillus alcalophilus]THG89288.1 molybdenum cofactor biosysynthesis protein [Alkalihalobacillus alcalophilus ATCC 27647 = CGMCC 1.3604]
MGGSVLAVSLSERHTFSKQNRERVHLVKGLGVEGDAHFGATVKHRSRVAQNPNQPNLRQVHLLQAELFEQLKERFLIKPGEMGENITTTGVDLLGLPVDTVLTIGPTVKIQLTGLRNPCAQIDQFQPGLMKAVLDKDQDGNLIRKAGVMAIVLAGGSICPGDSIQIQLPEKPFKPLERV